MVGNTTGRRNAKCMLLCVNLNLTATTVRIAGQLTGLAP